MKPPANLIIPVRTTGCCRIDEEWLLRHAEFVDLLSGYLQSSGQLHEPSKTNRVVVDLESLSVCLCSEITVIGRGNGDIDTARLYT